MFDLALLTREQLEDRCLLLEEIHRNDNRIIGDYNIEFDRLQRAKTADLAQELGHAASDPISPRMEKLKAFLGTLSADDSRELWMHIQENPKLFGLECVQIMEATHEHLWVLNSFTGSAE